MTKHGLKKKKNRQKKRLEFWKDPKSIKLFEEREKERRENLSMDEKFSFLLQSSYFKVCPNRGTGTESGRKQPRNNYFFIISIMRKY